MKTTQFLELLKQHQGKSLLFEYTKGQLVAANYHITEVKHLRIDSVDCGANSDSWNETIVQLWESPEETDKKAFMSAYKALSILRKVGKMRPYDLESEIKFEYGNDHFHTAQLFVDDYSLSDGQLIFQLTVVKTDCKAKEQCGIPEMAGVSASEACCSPGSGCC